MVTEEVIENFEPNTQTYEERSRVMLWRNWRVSSLDIIKERMEEMWEEEEWALNWLDTDDIYVALNP